MGVDIYKRNENRNRLFEISEELYGELSKVGLIGEFERKTSVFIDDIGKSRLTYQHSKILVDLLRGYIKNKKLPTETATGFMNFLETLIKTETDVDLVGD